MTDLRHNPVRAGLAAIAVALALAGSACATRAVRSPDAPTPSFTVTSYAEESARMFLGVDVRASRLTGPRSFLPVGIALVHKGDEERERWTFGRESFVLELPDGRNLPLASYDEFTDAYDRGRADLRLGEAWLGNLAGRFPQPPFTWIPLEFFPPRGSGTFPRDRLNLRNQQVVQGFLYFPLPEDAPTAGRYKVLFTPVGQETYVVDFEPFRVKEKG